MSGQDLKAERARRGLKLRELADAAGVTVQLVHKWENLPSPRPETCAKYLQAVSDAESARASHYAQMEATAE